MNFSEVQSEISAQSKLVDEILLNQEMVTGIDRHIKDQEQKLNDRFVPVSVTQVLMSFLPPDKLGQLATRVDDTVWNSLKFTHVWRSRRNMHEEISFDRREKGFAFFYTMGEVVYDLGIIQDQGGFDSYVRIIEDKRERFKLTGAPVEVKVRAFVNLRELIFEINNRANNAASRYVEEITNRYSTSGNR